MGSKYKHLLLASFAAIFVAFSVNVFTNSTPAYADRLGSCTPEEIAAGSVTEVANSVTNCVSPKAANGAGGQNGATTTNGDVTCAIEKLGWVLCPLIETSAWMGDKAFQLLANHFLETDPELVASVTPGSTPTGTYLAWEMARNIANILFVIAFLIIIYSQVTGAGLTNYGIKKMLPRLIIAVIAVNVSYYICQLMVDLTNILGYTIKDFMVQASVEISDRAAMPTAAANHSISQTSSSNVLQAIAIGALGLTGIVLLITPLLSVSVLAIVIGCLAIVVVLLMRKAFIVLLVVASPVAFVAYLLPNTERYFKKWASMFWQLLLVFPIVALLFGGGQLASAIVLIAGTNRGSDATATTSVYDDNGQRCIQLPLADPTVQTDRTAIVGSCGTGSTPFTLGLTAAVIAVAPLFAVWAVLKGALSAAGSIGGKIGGTITSLGDKAGRGARKPEDWLKKQGYNAAKTGLTTAAVRNRWPGARTVRNFQKRGERSKSDLERELHDFDRSGSTAAIQKQIDGNSQFKSAQAITASKAVQDMIAKGEIDLKGMAGGAYAPAGIAEAIDAQMKRANDEVIKGIKEGFRSTNVTDMKSDFIAAARSGDKLRAKAMLDLLAGSGSAGITAIHEGYDAAGIAGGSDMDTALRERIQTDNPGAKNSDASIKAWADGAGVAGNPNAGLGDYHNDGATWEKEIDQLDKFTRMSGSMQRHAYDKMGAAHQQWLTSQARNNPSGRSGIDKTVLGKMRL